MNPYISIIIPAYNEEVKIKDTLEILKTDKYKVVLDGSWVEITEIRTGKEIYSGNTTARTVREAYDIARKNHMVDSYIKNTDADYEQPKYKKGQKFTNSYGTFEILGTHEVTADYNTGRKGIVYEVKWNERNSTIDIPCWQFEKEVQKGIYKIKDTKSFNVNYKGRTFLVDARTKKEAAQKIIKNLK